MQFVGLFECFFFSLFLSPSQRDGNVRSKRLRLMCQRATRHNNTKNNNRKEQEKISHGLLVYLD